MAAEGTEKAQVQGRTTRASSMRAQSILSLAEFREMQTRSPDSILAVQFTGIGSGKGNPPVYSCLKTQIPFQMYHLFSFPAFVGFQAPNLSECPRNRLETEARTGEDRVASAD